MTLRIGLLWPQANSNWTAGGLYYENLLRSLTLAGKIDEVVVIEPEGGSFSVNSAKRFSNVPVVTYAERANLGSLAARVIGAARRRLERPDPVFADALKRARVDVAFGDMDYTRRPIVPWVAWIPDFQHLHYPENFSAKELQLRDIGYSTVARRASAVVLSSQDALNDFKRFVPGFASKGRVAPFVSLMPEAILTRDASASVAKYHLAERFVVVPNQWWRHKNHRTAIEAAAILRDRGLNLRWVMTGALADYRGTDHVSGLLQLIAERDIQDKLVILGVLPRDEQVDLMRAASMIVQPSLFEGWSTVVEDAKTLGQRLVVSDIEVHREQLPPASLFFAPESPEDLANKVEAMLAGACQRVDERAAVDASLVRASQFGSAFYAICADATRDAQ